MLPVIFRRTDFSPTDLNRLMAALKAMRKRLHERGTTSALRYDRPSGSYRLMFTDPESGRVHAAYTLAKSLNEGLAHAAINPPHLTTVINEIYSSVIGPLEPTPGKTPETEPPPNDARESDQIDKLSKLLGFD